jgi:RNA polymerase sigma-70 factor (ECF subfamily)
MDTKTHESQKVLKLLLKKSGGDLTASKEAMQNAYCAAIKSFHTFKHKSSYFTWICRIALNKLSDYYRDQINRESKVIIPSVEKFNSLFDPHLAPEERMALDDLRKSCSECLDLLPTKYRQLLQFKYYEQLSNSEICLKLNLSARSLEGLMYRAKKLLVKIVRREKPELAKDYQRS